MREWVWGIQFVSIQRRPIDKPETITGGCLCGVVRYEVSEPPSGGGTCHCRTCQRATFLCRPPGSLTPGRPKRHAAGYPREEPSAGKPHARISVRAKAEWLSYSTIPEM